jgi:hypothetical protein
MSANPYSPPKAALETHAAGGYWREGSAAVMRPGTTLPARCVKCNQPAAQPMKLRKLYWHHPAWYLLFFINILIYAIVALIVRRKAEVTYGVCARHRRRRLMFIATGFVGIGIGIALIVVNPPAGFATALAALLVGVIGSRVAYARRITKEEVRLAGCGEAFLASLDGDAKAPPARVALGHCPKCQARVPMDALACLRCKAVFTPGTELQVRA